MTGIVATLQRQTARVIENKSIRFLHRA